MSEEGFLQDIIANPNNDAARLIFADWLDDHKKGGRAEFIRLQCDLEPHCARFDDPEINKKRDRMLKLLQPLRRAEQDWLRQLHGPMRFNLRVNWRRGFVDSLELPVQWLIEHGEQLRQRYPTLRKLVVFRLNGWGERLAQCPWLEGIRELELPCWYSDEDAEALSQSPQLKSLERLVLWSEPQKQQIAIFAQGSLCSSLQNLHYVEYVAPDDQWLTEINQTAKRPIVTMYEFDNEPFCFAPDFHHDFVVGKLPDGTQIFISTYEGETEIEGVAFAPDGKPLEEPFQFSFPNQKAARNAKSRCKHLHEQIGFEPAFIRVERFKLGQDRPIRIRNEVEDHWNACDNPGEAPEKSHTDVLGYGELVYDWVSNGCFVYYCGNDWWCDRSGHIIST